MMLVGRAQNVFQVLEHNFHLRQLRGCAKPVVHRSIRRMVRTLRRWKKFCSIMSGDWDIGFWFTGSIWAA